MALFLFLVTNGNYVSSSFGLALSLYIVLLFVNNLGKTIPVIEFMALLFVIQLILSPYYSYLTEFEHLRYSMAVSEDVYMGITVPLIFAFYLSAIFFRRKFYIDHEKLSDFLNRYPKFPFFLISIGILSLVLARIIPLSLAFLIHLSSFLLYVGAIAIIFSDSKNKWKIFFAIMLIPLFSSIYSGMFGGMIYIYTFVGMYVFTKLRTKPIINGFIILAAVMFINTLQMVKTSYRELTWYAGDHTNIEKVEIFFDLWMNQLFESNPELEQTIIDESITIRYNQGWIVSNIYAYIPEFSEGLKGSSIISAIQASLIPRLLSKNKMTVKDTKEDFEKMTGIALTGNTSMAASLIGEAYGNFQFYGAMIFLFFWGLFMAYITVIYNRITTKYVYMIFFVPILYITLVRGSEGNFLTIMNWLVKSSFFLFFVLYIMKRKFPVYDIRLSSNVKQTIAS